MKASAIAAVFLMVATTSCALAEDSPVMACVVANAANPAFAPLRPKMTLLLSDEQNFETLSNTSKPTREEKKLIAAWAGEFERCSKLGRADRMGSPLGTAINSYHSSLIAAAADLHASKINYGQYAKRQQELLAELDSKVSAITAAWKQQQAAQQAEERRAAEMERQAALQDEQARRQMALQYMLNQQRPQQAPTNIIIRPRQESGIQTCIYSGTC